MARKKKRLSLAPAAKIVLVGITAIIIGVLLFKGIHHFFVRSDYFKIKIIVIDPSLQFIQKRDLAYLKGKSIFVVDLKAFHRKLSFKYPQITQLRINRNFPNQISLKAVKREPLAQIQLLSKIITVDQHGIVLQQGDAINNALPVIKGVKTKIAPKLGLPVRGIDLRIALKIIRLFENNSRLKGHHIYNVNVENLSKIEFDIKNMFKIVLDRENIDQKINLLGVVLTQGQLKIKEIKYIDLRFKEPILGKK